MYLKNKRYFDHVGYLLLNSYRKKVNVKLKGQAESINTSRLHSNSRAEFSERLQPARSFSNAAVFQGLSKTVDKRPNGKRKRCVFLVFFSSPCVARLCVLFFKDWQTPPDKGLELQSFNWIVHLGEAVPPPTPPPPLPTPSSSV